MLGPDITEQRSWSHSHAGQLGPFQHVQMSQECAELGTTSLLPSPPPTPHPLICLLKLCLHPTPFLFHLSLGGPLAYCPSGPLLQPSFLSRPLKGVTECRSPSPSADPMG